ncbi:MAG: hydrogenase formation protein HypD [Clostridia bacterium]|nr:hydrogenase formation protein HypD [Clostridia bacterium]
MSKVIDEFRNSALASKMGEVLAAYTGKPVTLMEVCGTHTMSIFRYGIRDLLPPNIRLVSGPGCPVCVTPGYFMDAAVSLCQREDVIIATFGDMMRVPGSETSLLKEKALGRDIRIVYSPLDSINIARENPGKKVVFLSIGFETTLPVIALSVIKAKEEGVYNYSILSSNKTIPEALKLLAGDKDIGVDGFLYPGHVSAIIGTSFYLEMAEKFKIPGVVAGFEPVDLLNAIIKLVQNINENQITVENLYSRFVTEEGNLLAKEKIYEVFEASDENWRGIGSIPGSGLKVKSQYAAFDAWKVFRIGQGEWKEPQGCLCGEVLKGKKTPKECKLFGKTCIPENPVGACMVSSEGTCAAYYKYGGTHV